MKFRPLAGYLPKSAFPAYYSVTLRWLQWKVILEEAAKHFEKILLV